MLNCAVLAVFYGAAREKEKKVATYKAGENERDLLKGM